MNQITLEINHAFFNLKKTFPFTNQGIEQIRKIIDKTEYVLQEILEE